jgi:hypothetical protein
MTSFYYLFRVGLLDRFTLLGPETWGVLFALGLLHTSLTLAHPLATSKGPQHVSTSDKSTGLSGSKKSE